MDKARMVKQNFINSKTTMCYHMKTTVASLVVKSGTYRYNETSIWKHMRGN